MQKNPKISLDDAYALKTPADNVALYRHWAETYDVEFAQNRGYQYPQKIADIFHLPSRFELFEDPPLVSANCSIGNIE